MTNLHLVNNQYQKNEKLIESRRSVVVSHMEKNDKFIVSYSGYEIDCDPDVCKQSRRIAVKLLNEKPNFKI